MLCTKCLLTQPGSRLRFQYLRHLFGAALVFHILPFTAKIGQPARRGNMGLLRRLH